MSPYRTADPKPETTVTTPTLWGRIRSRLRRQRRRWAVLCGGGTYRYRFPVKCPICRKRSWCPDDQLSHFVFGRHLFDAYRADHYRCGHTTAVPWMDRLCGRR